MARSAVRPPRASRRSRYLPSWLHPSNAGVVYALAILVTILSVAAASTGRPSYVSPTNVSNILDQTALLGIVVITSTIVLISGNFDLSVGSVAALGAAVCLATLPSLGFWGAFLLALAAGAGVGLFNGIVVQFVGINAFIVTLGTLTAVRGLVLILTDGRTVTAGEGAARDALRALDDGRFVTPNLYLVVALALFAVAGVRAWLVRRKPGGWTTPAVLAPALAGLVVAALSPVLIFTVELTERAVYLFVFVALAGLVMRYTAVGRRLYACGGNAEAARLSGISVNRYKVVAFTLNGTAAALVGVLFASRLGSINPTGLSGFELTALAAAILGGTSLFGGLGSVVKSLVGALILVTLANGFNILNLGANFQGLIEGIVLITAAGMYTIALRRQQSSRIGSHEEPAPADLPPPPTLVPAAPELAAVRREEHQ